MSKRHQSEKKDQSKKAQSKDELQDLELALDELDEVKGGSGGETQSYSFTVTNHGALRGVVLRDYDFKAGMD